MTSYPVVVRPASHWTDYGPRRPNVGGFLHNTAGFNTVTTAGSAGSWHFQIGREGTRYVDVPLRLGAWGVAACGSSAASRAVTRWRPGWLLPAPGGLTSDPNYCGVHIELVSGAGGPVPAGYEPYTDEQYASLAELLDELTPELGPIPWVAHADVQTDRSDPNGFDWDRAGFGPWVPGWGRLWLGGASVPAVVPGPDEEWLPMETTAEEREAMRPYFEQAGVAVNMDTAIMKRAALAYLREESRGPAKSDEYPAVAPSGAGVTRQNFTAGIAEWNGATGEVGWVEVVTHPESIAA